MDNTKYLGLEKPSQEDFYDVEVQNRNMDIIDIVIKEHKHTLDDINGSVPIERGGTGASTLEQALENLGLSNAAKIQKGTYVGNGTKDGFTLTFDFQPLIVIISDTSSYAILVYGVPAAMSFYVKDDVYTETMTIMRWCEVSQWLVHQAYWGIDPISLTVSYTTENHTINYNESGEVYNYVALG